MKKTSIYHSSRILNISQLLLPLLLISPSCNSHRQSSLDSVSHSATESIILSSGSSCHLDSMASRLNCHSDSISIVIPPDSLSPVVVRFYNVTSSKLKESRSLDKTTKQTVDSFSIKEESDIRAVEKNHTSTTAPLLKPVIYIATTSMLLLIYCRIRRRFSFVAPEKNT